MGINSMDKKLDSVNLLASDRYFHALDSVLRKESSEYAILARKEWKTCLTNDNGKWKVSFIERNKDVKPMYFSDVNDACLYLIDSVSPKRKVKKIREQYLNKVGTEPALVNKSSKYLFDLQKIAMF